MKRVVLSLAFSLLSTAGLLAQGGAVRGYVVDKTNSSPLIGATVSVKGADDRVRGDVADKKGQFLIANLPAGNYTMQLRSLGYTEMKKTITIKANDTLDLHTVGLTPTAVLTNTVEVEAAQIRGEQKGDTSEFNAKAFKTDKNGTAEDLIKKMPGVDIDATGTVKAQGENVQQVLVDGKPFFGNDPATTLKTLPSDIIDKVQIYDQASDQAQFTRFDDGVRNKTLNVITKADKRVGVFGKLSAGYGTDSRYNLNGNINVFNGDQRISLLAMANNVNEQNFSIQDIIGAMGGGNNSYMRMAGRSMAMFTTSGGGKSSAPRGPGSNNDFTISPNDGISKSAGIGLNYSDQFGSSFGVSGSYFYNRTTTEQNQNVNRTYITNNEVSQTNPQSNQGVVTNINNRLNIRADYSIDSMNSILLSPRFTWQSNDNSSNSNSSIFSGSTGSALSNSVTSSLSNGSAYNLGTDLLYRLRFATVGRTFSASLSSAFRNSDSKSTNTSDVTLFFPDSTINLYQDVPTDGKTTTLSANLAYTEPIATNHQLQLSYNISNTSNSSNRFTYNLDSLGNEVLPALTLLSSQATSQYLTQRPGLSYRFSILPNPDSANAAFDPLTMMGRGGPGGGHGGPGGRMLSMMGGAIGTWTFGIGADYQMATLANDQSYPTSFSSTHQYYNILPNFSLVARPTATSNVRLIYRTSTNAPSSSQLQDVIDNSDPLHLSRGNSALKPEYTHTIFANYGEFNIATATGLFLMAHLNLTQDHIISSTYTHGVAPFLNDTLPVGSQFSMPVNHDGYMNVNSFLVYSFVLELWRGFKLNMNTNVGGMYTHDITLIDSATNYANTLTFTPSIGFSSNISEYTDFSLSARTAYSTLKNTLQQSLNSNYTTTTLIARGTFISHDSSDWFDGWLCSMDFNYIVTSGLSSSYNTAVPLLNFGIGKRFLDQRAEIKLSVFDALNKNNTISRTTGSGYFDDTQTQVLHRYLMLTLTYNLRSFMGAK